MKKACLVAITVASLLASKGISQVTVDWIPGLHYSGGEFNIAPVIGTGYSSSVLMNGGYETFCIGEDVSLGSIPGIFYETINTNGVHATDSFGGTKVMAAGTAWLYSQFATGVLTGYDYINIVGGNRALSANDLQFAIWTLEGTYWYGSDQSDLAGDLGKNAFLDQAAAHFGGGVAGLATAMLPNSPGGFNVGALNLNLVLGVNIMGAPVQPMLTLLTPPPPQTNTLTGGDAATIGFWHNKNGQALIICMPKSPALGNWLAGNFPCLYGNLAGKANSVVAAQFMTYFNVTGQKTYAQVMGGALACYVSSSTISGTTKAGKYGFNVSSGGTGAKTYNVGSLGTVLGLSNNTSYTVLQLLQAANANCPFSPAVFDALNTIFSGINQTGDIN